MSGIHEVIQQIRDELRGAFKKAEGNAAEQAQILSYLEQLTSLQEEVVLDDLLHHAAVLNGLSDLLETAIADIRANIACFMLGNLERIKSRVDQGAGKAHQTVPAADDTTRPSAPSPTVSSPPAAPARKPTPTTQPTSTPGNSPTDFARSRTPHRKFPESVTWSTTRTGLSIDGAPPETTDGPPETVRRVWAQFGPAIMTSAQAYGVPAELIVATICAESGGDEHAIRFEPGYISDQATPGKVSPGLMQTLISTARGAMNDPTIDRARLLVAANSIAAGTAYIRSQFQRTGFDPPLVACAYNAGSVVLNDSVTNRWRMRQFPIGTSRHADRFVRWLNDAFRYFATLNPVPPVTFVNLIPP